LSKYSLHIPYEIVEAADLPADELQLLEAALKATEGAFAPYSGFHVGCSLLLEDGEIISGNNQENVAYPSGLCAERTALFYAGSIGKADKMRKMAIRATSEHFEVAEPPTSCGACRQVMVEYEKRTGHDVVVLMQGKTGKVLRLNGVKNCLLPFSFDLEI
jgi:cytidine deaminase